MPSASSPAEPAGAGIPGSGLRSLSGRRVRVGAARQAAVLHPGAADRRAGQPEGGPGTGVLRAAGRHRGDPLQRLAGRLGSEVRTGGRDPRGRDAAGGRRRVRLLPRQRQRLSRLLLRGPDLRVAGEGDLLARIERLRRQLRSEGLLERQKQLPLPILPRSIGVITGESGKARDDVLAALQRRGWRGRLVWAFTPVQDRHAAPAICRALADLAAVAEVEVAIVARGGGSQADLLALSDETLCRTVAMCAIPVIASVGHHSDRTLLDDVAAVSCSTPTHAAEAAVGIDCGRARLETMAAAVRLRDHGRRAVLSRARTLTMLSRAPAGRLERQRGTAAPAAAGTAGRSPAAAGQRAGPRPPAGDRARAQDLLDAARLPPAAPAGARAAGAGAGGPRPPADTRTGLRARLLARRGAAHRRGGRARGAAAAPALRRRRAGREVRER